MEQLGENICQRILFQVRRERYDCAIMLIEEFINLFFVTVPMV